MTTMSIPTNLLAPPDSVEDDDFAAPRAGGDRDSGGSSVAGLVVDSEDTASKLHRIFTEEDDIWHEIMLYAWVFDTLSLRQVSLVDFAYWWPLFSVLIAQLISHLYLHRLFVSDSRLLASLVPTDADLSHPPRPLPPSRPLVQVPPPLLPHPWEKN